MRIGLVLLVRVLQVAKRFQQAVVVKFKGIQDAKESSPSLRPPKMMHIPDVPGIYVPQTAYDFAHSIAMLLLLHRHRLHLRCEDVVAEEEDMKAVVDAEVETEAFHLDERTFRRPDRLVAALVVDLAVAATADYRLT